MKWILMPCEEATLNMEKSFSEKISPIQEVKLKGHLLFCKCCRSYSKKIGVMDKILSDITLDKEENKISDTDLINFKEKLKEKLNK